MNGTEPNDFRASLPRGPLVEHICQVQHVLIFLGGDPYGKHSVEVAEHSLRTIANYTAEREERLNPLPAQRSTGTHDRPGTFDINKFSAGIKSAAEGLTKGIQTLRDGIAHRHANASPEYKERLARARYQSLIKEERQKGRAFVQAEARRVHPETAWLRRGSDGKARA